MNAAVFRRRYFITHPRQFVIGRATGQRVEDDELIAFVPGHPNGAVQQRTGFSVAAEWIAVPRFVLPCGFANHQHSQHAGAFRLYKAAADQGLVSSMQAVGGFYYDGKGVPQNYDEALKWYRKAAERGFAQSQYNLGVMYYTGTALTQSNAQAYLWFALAAAAGDALAPAARDEVAKKLSAAELSKMQAQAIRWKTITP